MEAKENFKPREEESYDVFISHPGDGGYKSGWAMLLKSLFENLNIHVFVDEIELKPCNRSLEEIESVARRAKVFLVLFDNNYYLKSKYCMTELADALERIHAQHIFPVFMNRLDSYPSTEDELPRTKALMEMWGGEVWRKKTLKLIQSIKNYTGLRVVEDRVQHEEIVVSVESILRNEQALNINDIRNSNLVQDRIRMVSGFKINFQQGFNPISFAESKAKLYEQGTREWLFGQIKRWYELDDSLPSSTAFVLLGKAGIGKSVALAELCRRGGALSSTKRDSDLNSINVGAIHFFQHDNEATNDPIRAIKSISYQLQQSIPGFGDNLVDIDTADMDSLTIVFENSIETPSRKLKRPNRAVLIVLDALDECRLQQRKQLLNLLQRKWSRKSLPSWMKLLVSTRPQDYIPHKLRIFNPTELKPDNKQNREDLRRYFRKRLLQERVAVSNLDAAVEIMLQRSEGLFLYVHFLPDIIQHVKAKHGTSSLTIDILENQLPNSLDGYYSVYFQRLLDENFNGSENLYNQVLAPIACARSPLPIEILQNVCSCKSSKEFRTKFWRFICELVCENNQRVRFMHKSMADFLTNMEKSDNLSVDIVSGHSLIADWCLKNKNRVFSLENTIYHLGASQRYDEVDHLLSSCYSWLRRVVEHAVENSSLPGILEDCTKYSRTRNARYTTRALQLSAYALRIDVCQLPAQLLARLNDHHPLLSSIESERNSYKGTLPVSKGILIKVTSPLMNTLTAGSAGINSVSFSPDSRRIACGAWDRNVRIWDAETLELLETLKGHTAQVWSVCFSPDSKILVSTSFDQTIRLWNVETGELLQLLEGHTEQVWSAAFCCSGERIITASDDKTVRFWDIETGKMLKIWKHPCGVLSVNCNANCSYIASASQDELVRIWDFKALTPKQLCGHTARVWCVLFAPQGDKIASSSDDTTVRLWDVETLQCYSVLKGHLATVWNVAFSPDGTKLASGSWDCTVRLWSAITSETLYVFTGHTDSVYSVAFSSDGNRILSGSDDSAIYFWDLRSEVVNKARKRRLRTANYRGKSATFLLNEDAIVSGTANGTVQKWSVRSGELVESSKKFNAALNCLALSSEGNIIATGSDDGKIGIWDSDTLESINVFKGHSARILSVDIAPNGNILATGSDDNAVCLWNLITVSLIRKIQVHTNRVWSVVFFPNCKRIASGSDDNTVSVWDLELESAWTLKGHHGAVYCVAVSPTGESLASASDDCTIRIWDMDMLYNCKKLLKGHTAKVVAVTFLPCGKILISGSDDQRIISWCTNTGATLKIFDAYYHCWQPSSPISLDYAPESNKVVYKSVWGELWLIDLTSQRLLRGISDGGEEIHVKKLLTSYMQRGAELVAHKTGKERTIGPFGQNNNVGFSLDAFARLIYIYRIPKENKLVISGTTADYKSFVCEEVETEEILGGNFSSEHLV